MTYGNQTKADVSAYDQGIEREERNVVRGYRAIEWGARSSGGRHEGMEGGHDRVRQWMVVAVGGQAKIEAVLNGVYCNQERRW